MRNAETDYGAYVREMPGKNRSDLTLLFATPSVLQAAVEALAAPFYEKGVTKVAALDALGFALGGGVAHLLGAGLVLIRKGNKVAWEVETVEFRDYSGEVKHFEIAKDAVSADDRVLLVDDWSETGAQLKAAITLLERLQSKVVGAALVNVEDEVLRDPFLNSYNLHSLLRT